MLNFALNNDMPLLQKSAKKKGSQKLSFYYNFVKTFYWHKTFTGRWNKTVNITCIQKKMIHLKMALKGSVLVKH